MCGTRSSFRLFRKYVTQIHAPVTVHDDGESGRGVLGQEIIAKVAPVVEDPARGRVQFQRDLGAGGVGRLLGRPVGDPEVV